MSLLIFKERQIGRWCSGSARQTLTLKVNVRSIFVLRFYFCLYLQFVRIVNILDHGVIGNTVDFDSAIVGSIPAGPAFVVIVFSDYF